MEFKNYTPEPQRFAPLTTTIRFANHNVSQKEMVWAKLLRNVVFRNRTLPAFLHPPLCRGVVAAAEPAPRRGAARVVQLAAEPAPRRGAARKGLGFRV